MTQRLPIILFQPFLSLMPSIRNKIESSENKPSQYTFEIALIKLFSYVFKRFKKRFLANNSSEYH